VSSPLAGCCERAARDAVLPTRPWVRLCQRRRRAVIIAGVLCVISCHSFTAGDARDLHIGMRMECNANTARHLVQHARRAICPLGAAHFIIAGRQNDVLRAEVTSVSKRRQRKPRSGCGSIRRNTYKCVLHLEIHMSAVLRCRWRKVEPLLCILAALRCPAATDSELSGNCTGPRIVRRSAPQSHSPLELPQ
jgi:hypothetical protein